MKRLLLSLFAVALTTLTFGQTDTIFSNNDKISCIVKEITPDAVKYSFPGEDLINTIYKNSVQKIVLKNGRVQTFTKTTSVKSVENVNDYDNVVISQADNDIKGLYKLGNVSSKAKGASTEPNQEKVEERAYKKLKIQAAMMGANFIYLIDQNTEGKKYGTKNLSLSTSETNLSGIAYTNSLPSFDDFKKLISDKEDFVAILESNIWSSASDMAHFDIQKQFTINNISNEDGMIMIDGVLEGISNVSKYRVVSFTKDYFNIFYQSKSTYYNIKIKL